MKHPIRLDLYGLGWTSVGQPLEMRLEVGWTHILKSLESQGEVRIFSWALSWELLNIVEHRQV